MKSMRRCMWRRACVGPVSGRWLVGVADCVLSTEASWDLFSPLSTDPRQSVLQQSQSISSVFYRLLESGDLARARLRCCVFAIDSIKASNVIKHWSARAEDETVIKQWLKVWQGEEMSLRQTALLFLVLTTRTALSQRRITGDIDEQKISQWADFDAREERVYR